MPGTMRGVYTNLTAIRRRVFAEVAKLAYAKDMDPDELAHEFDELPYKIIPGDVATYRESVFLERAVVGERIRLAMGLSYQGVDRPERISDGLKDAMEPETYYQPPLINIIKFACNACKDNVYEVTNTCQGCLAHPCREICPKGAISFVNKKAFIDQEKCVHCGQCMRVCPYQAIHHHVRPCAAACGMHAISSDENGRADIDYEKCVSCGQCLVNCPFGAIADKSQLFQVIQAINSGAEVIAVVAPAFVGQYGGRGDIGKLKSMFKELGFSSTEEVAVGADLCTVQEADDYIEEVPEHKPFLGTSCCPAWASMAKKEFPEHADCISMALTPMVLAARLVRSFHPDAKIVFVGPCAAKKLEAMRRSVRSEVDFVLTFEEVAAMMEAKGIKYLELQDDGETEFVDSSADGRGFAVSGGVAKAVVDQVKAKYGKDIPVFAAEGLDDCRAMMKKAVKGQFDGYLLEGMACPGGCVAGAGTLVAINKTTALVKSYARRAGHVVAGEDINVSHLDDLTGAEMKKVVGRKERAEAKAKVEAEAKAAGTADGAKE